VDKPGRLKVNKNKKLASQLAAATAVAMLVGTSAFAESRHHDETRSSGRSERSSSRSEHSGDRGSVRTEQRSTETNNQRFERNGSFNREEHNGGFNREQRSTSNWNRERESRSGNESWNRNAPRGENFYRNNQRVVVDSHFRGGRAPAFYSGRVSRYERWNNGFRVWIGGAPYPFFVPEAYFRIHPFHVGLSIRLGGYYNPLGYYDYYDGPYYDGGYYNSTVTAGDLRGVVESVDYRRGTLVLRDDVSGNFVTAQMRGRDRVMDTLRTGDYVVLSGDWVRGGVFEAYRADLLNDGNGDYRR
jgi:hypothetical protein